jgi:hypothetical protein
MPCNQTFYPSTKFLGHARRTIDIKSMIAMARAAFNKKKTLFNSNLDLNLRKKTVKCYIALSGAETWKLHKVDQKYLGSYLSQFCKCA